MFHSGNGVYLGLIYGRCHGTCLTVESAWGYPVSPVYCFTFTAEASCLCLSTLLLPYLGIAIAAIDRPVPTGLEGHFCVFAAFGTHRRIHLASLRRTAFLVISLRPPRLPARGAPLRLVGVALGAEELLLIGAKGKLDATIDTLKCLVLGNHTGRPPMFYWRLESPAIPCREFGTRKMTY